jgi:hypothetical protein
MTEMRPVSQPVFVHSSFRTSSTWVWHAFRRNPQTMAFHEIFHEILALLKPHEVAGNAPRTMNLLRHPDTEPYFLEFLPLLSPEGGIPGFSTADAFDTFIPHLGFDGELSAGELHRLTTAVGLARQEQRTPVLTCTRSLGRMGAIKRAIGGWHIFTHRNLFQQWMSYLSLLNDGTPHFVKTVATTLRLNGHDPFIAVLAQRVLSDDSPPDYCGFHDLTAAFLGFAGLHVYISMYAAMTADQVVDVNRLAVDPAYAATTAATISHACGVAVDLTDARQTIESAGRLPGEFQVETAPLEGLLAEAAQHLGLNVEADAYRFGQRLLAELLTEATRHRFYTKTLQRDHVAALTLLDATVAELAEARRQLAAVKMAVGASAPTDADHFKLDLTADVIGSHWYAAERAGDHVWRWSGPHNVSTLVLPGLAAERLRLRLSFNAAPHDIDVSVEGVAIPLTPDPAVANTLHGFIERPRRRSRETFILTVRLPEAAMQTTGRRRLGIALLGCHLDRLAASPSG